MNYFLFIFSFAFIGIFIPDPEPEIIIEKRLAELVQEFVSIKYSKFKMKEYIYVGVKRQRLYLISDTTVVLSYPISTAKNGVGSEKLSEKTPLGLHKIESMVGENTPLNGIILGTRFTGKTATIITEAKKGDTDDVTTRAMRLEGLENKINKGGNKDSYSREIYIHGTPEEGLIGTPVSHGCIRMKNNDVIELFNRVKTGTYVIILNN
jgi:lipoprotein-anchoring transpeptidase ErfK/SrfK